jgi:hypothetical protein
VNLLKLHSISIHKVNHYSFIYCNDVCDKIRESIETFNLEIDDIDNSKKWDVAKVVSWSFTQSNDSRSVNQVGVSRYGKAVSIIWGLQLSHTSKQACSFPRSSRDNEKTQAFWELSWIRKPRKMPRSVLESTRSVKDDHLLPLLE